MPSDTALHYLGERFLVAKGFFEVFGANANAHNAEAGQADLQQGLPTLVYYSRKNAGTPKISPKAGNM